MLCIKPDTVVDFCSSVHCFQKVLLHPVCCVCAFECMIASRCTRCRMTFINVVCLRCTGFRLYNVMTGCESDVSVSLIPRRFFFTHTPCIKCASLASNPLKIAAFSSWHDLQVPPRSLHSLLSWKTG